MPDQHDDDQTSDAQEPIFSTLLGGELRLKRMRTIDEESIKVALRDEAWLTASHSCCSGSLPLDAAVQQEP
jgi:hypothetical protein